MTNQDVVLGKKLDKEQLEEIIKKAAGEMGWTAKIVHKYDNKYDLNTGKQYKEISRSEMQVRGKLLKAITITGVNRSWPVDTVTVWSNDPFEGYASKKRISEFLGHLAYYVGEAKEATRL